MAQLFANCFNEIVEYLESDKVTLHSCLLVNRFFCDISVRILWRSVWNHSTLISCLSNESKDILYKNEIIISIPTSNYLLFNYVSFIKILSIYDINNIIKKIIQNFQTNTLQNLNHKKYIITQELFKLFMNRSFSIKELQFYSSPAINISNVTFTGARDCLKHLKKSINNGKILKEFYVKNDCVDLSVNDDLLNLAISKFCPNLRKLFIIFKNNKLESLKTIFIGCQYLESIEIWCGIGYLNENDLFRIIAQYSPRNFYELEIFHYNQINYFRKN
ncbi:hypothetical protein C1645_837307 [Glomus cerebriforme]|uniref:F-box domain-containing protein n=1 Tax=Glomus cerebriforme TaxID=658196 RepID=A0A397SAB2_9GLOM|nr:hypothetical protein C1645_837307 [Glomus cerebriforme]